METTTLTRTDSPRHTSYSGELTSTRTTGWQFRFDVPSRITERFTYSDAGRCRPDALVRSDPNRLQRLDKEKVPATLQPQLDAAIEEAVATEHRTAI